MSSFVKKLKHPKTGKMQVALCIDNYYGDHIYGYGFRKDGQDAKILDGYNNVEFFNFEDN